MGKRRSQVNHRSPIRIRVQKRMKEARTKQMGRESDREIGLAAFVESILEA